jgi:hypothetical protein
MENGQFLEKLLAVVSGNTTVISELRKVVEKLQDKLYDLPDKAEFKAYDKTCSAIDLTVGDIKDAVVKIDGRLDEIDKWQKVRLPIVVGLLTLIIYAIGFFFTIDKVADMINERHEQPAQEETTK